MKLSLIGYYGGNFGDLLMLSTLIDYYKDKFSEIAIFTYGDKDTLDQAIAFQRKNVRLETFSLLKTSISQFQSQVKGSSAIIWGGGTCFMDQGGTGGIKYMTLAKLTGIPVYYMGIGIDTANKLQTKMFIKLAGMISNRIFLRDHKSIAVAKELRVPYNKLGFVPDIAFLQATNETPRIFEEDYVVFSCRDLTEYKNLNNSEVNTKLAELTVTLCKNLKIRNVVNLICDSETDLEQAQLCEEIFMQNGLETKKVFGYELDAAVSSIKNAQFVLTARLHPAVLAQSSKVRYAIYNYSDKNLKFTEEENETKRLINRHQIDNYTFDFQPISTGHADGKKEDILAVLGEVA
ncbi:Polysaccharide pyruvyl transferase family protein WcaK [Dyadobacter sp. SG02]|uniref:polysaccharide pyruvyl transferase family protein n=1 Tax=Dyadobacter sp. SG02 TaxID=1855291 RepID=UPI0008C9C85A|nr:polysaccharide pyruvyl transferase family protein [Dyadobacter sp. SG02]SEJ72551.1 Polysaccharide pyruvyl transferase family protein WcaK [Dyadobacter sp. SG02]